MHRGSFTPGAKYALVDAHSGAKLLEAAPTAVERRSDRQLVGRQGLVVRLLHGHDRR